MLGLKSLMLDKALNKYVYERCEMKDIRCIMEDKGVYEV